MGHAGAFTAAGEPDARSKVKALECVGVTIVNHPAKFGDAIKTLLGELGRGRKETSTFGTWQRQSMHTRSRGSRTPISQSPMPKFQSRKLYIREGQAFNLLRERGIDASDYFGKGKHRLLVVAVDRQKLSPCVIASPTIDAKYLPTEAKYFPFDYRAGLDDGQLTSVAEHLQLGESSRVFLPKLITELVALFMRKEAFLLETKFVECLGGLRVVGARFGFDDAAFRSAKRQMDIHNLRCVEDEVPEEVEAERDGIVYIRLAGEGNIGTLVNGAGLAMNTIDALADLGGKAANFLDMGGKATSETIKKSFQIILRDKRVKVIFVNIFGGLTLGDMVARGILLAFKELEMRVPVVVRIRGTNEVEGQKMVRAHTTAVAGLLKVNRSLRVAFLSTLLIISMRQPKRPWN
jgi:succinyl-CoA synthetase alpha subunit